MLYPNAKVYFDGSHYIAIPHTERYTKKKPKLSEEIIEITDDNFSDIETKSEGLEEKTKSSFFAQFEEIETDWLPFKEDITERKTTYKKTRKTTKKQLFEELYKKYIDLPKKQRKDAIIRDMKPYFKTEELCKDFVLSNLDRKKRNLICRRVRMVRKANLINFDYFVTLTYSDELHNEQSFKKKLTNTLSHLQSRKGWKYIGVWERAPESNRLHFHGLFKIPEGTMPGELIAVKDYSTAIHNMQITYQNTYFNKNFGRSDFKKLNKNELGKSIGYLMKYLEKTGERIVYSRGLYQYFISDILEDDILTTIGQEDRKLLLFDDFYCLDEGVVMGRVCPEVIAQMRKCN